MLTGNAAVKERVMFKVRMAEPGDLPGIMKIERQTFGEVDASAMASSELMAERMSLLNASPSGWFWVAVDDAGEVVGDVILQPTDLGPDDCTSWAGATDSGCLTTTFKKDGRNIYIVSFAVRADVPELLVSLPLFRALIDRWKEHGGFLMFCSRMPGFARAHAQSGMSPGEYMLLRRGDGPRDSVLRLWWAVSGKVWPYKLLLNGYPPDAESGGHGALFALDDPTRAFCAVTELPQNGNRKNGALPVIQENDIRPELLQGGWRSWWDVGERRFIQALTLYIPFGCPDWGETGGRRNTMCAFCDLPNSVIGYREQFSEGRPIGAPEHIAMFRATLGSALEGTEPPHTLMIFNAGSFFAMPPAVRDAVVKDVAAREGIRRLVIESRAELITDDALLPVVSVLNERGIGLTVRIGVETQDDRLRLTVLRKGHSRKQLLAAAAVLREHGVRAGGYTLLNPAPGLDPQWAVEECLKTLDFVLDSGDGSLGMDEAYFCSTNVGGPVIEKEWREGRFAPASLWMVYATLRKAIKSHEGRVHLLPFKDVPELKAVPSNHVPQGIPENLSGARGCDRAFHAMFDGYRETMDPSVLIPPECSCRPEWIGSL